MISFLAVPQGLLLNHFSRVQLWDPIDGSPPGSPVPGILQASTTEWVAISFSNAWKWKVKVKPLSRVRLCDPWTAAHQAPPSMEFSTQEYWSGKAYRILIPRPGMEPMPPAVDVQTPNQWTTRESQSDQFWVESNFLLRQISILYIYHFINSRIC